MGISGSVTAALMPSAILWLRQNHLVAELDILVSRMASTFVSKRALSAICHGKVIVDSSRRTERDPLHITLTANADVFLIMPATANILAKAANGIADDLISTCVLAAACPVVFVPCMKQVMWNKPATERNVCRLREDGYYVVQPQTGYSVATNERETGGLPDIATVVDLLVSLLQPAIEVPRGREDG